MVFAVNCGLDGSPNSFTNFKKAALSIGASLSAAASSATPWPTAAYGGYTIPPAPEVTPVTQTVSVNDTVWTTTYNSYPGSPAPTPATLAGQIHRVIVGGAGGLVFDPPNIAALPRDVVVFELFVSFRSCSRILLIFSVFPIQPPEEPYCYPVFVR
jgi:hypothetical protein